MDYKFEILMLLAYNCYHAAHGHEHDYSEMYARQWGWEQVNSLTQNEVNSWFEEITSDMCVMEISYQGSHPSICLM